MMINPDWPKTDKPVSGSVLGRWKVPAPDGEPRAIVNILRQEVGVDLAGYAEANGKGGKLEKAGYTVIDSGFIAGSNGQELAYFEYTDDREESKLDHFVTFVAVTNGVAALATIGCFENYFDTMYSLVKPYLLTIEAVA